MEVMVRRSYVIVMTKMWMRQIAGLEGLRLERKRIFRKSLLTGVQSLQGLKKENFRLQGCQYIKDYQQPGNSESDGDH